MAEDGDEPVVNRRNIITGYDELNKIAEGVIVLNGKMDAVNEKLAERAKQHDDHEVRIRALEQVVALATGGRNAISGAWGWLVGAVGITLALVQYFSTP